MMKLTKDEILNMSAGRELDRMIDKYVFDNYCSMPLNYSTDMNDAMEIARKFIHNRFVLNYLPSDNINGEGWHCNINDYHVNKCKTPALAICKAALLATIEK